MNAVRKLFLVCFIAFSFQASLAQDDEFVFYSDLARDWYQGGDYFEWTSTTEDNNAKKVNVLLVHKLSGYLYRPVNIGLIDSARWYHSKGCSFISPTLR